MDIFVRLASLRDPIFVSYRRSLTCERCGQSGYSMRSKCCESHNIQDPFYIQGVSKVLAPFLIQPTSFFIDVMMLVTGYSFNTLQLDSS